uniref:HD domain-containing protein n=1 Tax=Schlesneria paludicola TaxID=360056 RepID=A0A7C2P853_9PLAN
MSFTQDPQVRQRCGPPSVKTPDEQDWQASVICRSPAVRSILAIRPVCRSEFIVGVGPVKTSHVATANVLELFRQRGGSLYGGEAVTEQEHALQAAWLAEQAGAPPALIVAALLHDIGHLLHNLPEDAPDHGIDDRHEHSGASWLRRYFGPEVAEPVRLHVAAKRYLCAVEPRYLQQLSAPSQLSLRLQGGAMSPEEVHDFERHPHAQAAVRLRHWDDAAKIAGLETPLLEHFARYFTQVDENRGEPAT